MNWFQNLMSDYRSIVHRSISYPEYYGVTVYKFIKIMGRTDFSYQFPKMIIRQKRIGYDLNFMRQSACLVINLITIDNFATLFNCTQVEWASDSMNAPTLSSSF